MVASTAQSARPRPSQAPRSRPIFRPIIRPSTCQGVNQGSNGVSNDDTDEAAWAHRAVARQKQIDIGKERSEYHSYLATVAIEDRTQSQPQTPDPHEQIPKRQFDRKLSDWRRMLHSFESSAPGRSSDLDTGNRSDPFPLPDVAVVRHHADEEADEQTWERRAFARQHQIDIGKARVEYQAYLDMVPLEDRTPSQPRTPDPCERISKRGFDKKLSDWRRSLHKYSDSTTGAEEMHDPICCAFDDEDTYESNAAEDASVTTATDANEPDAARIAQRQKQIQVGKARHEYRIYVAKIPKQMRTVAQPQTPDPYKAVSKREFDRILSEWRRQLHAFEATQKRQREEGPWDGRARKTGRR